MQLLFYSDLRPKEAAVDDEEEIAPIPNVVFDLLCNFQDEKKSQERVSPQKFLSFKHENLFPRCLTYEN